MPERISDVCVFGGGMVGSVAALGLARLGYTVTVIEPHPPEAFSAQQRPDMRVSAINRASQALLQDYGVWDRIMAMRAFQYEGLSVWEKQQYKTSFDATEIGQNYLGYFVENRVLQLATMAQIDAHYAEQIMLINQDPASSVDTHNGRVILNSGQVIQADMLLAADGANSQLRQAASIGTTGWQYHQQANVVLIKCEEAFAAETWQQFTPDGPIAFLPFDNQYAWLVWYADGDLSAQIAQANEQTLTQMIRRKYGDLLPAFSVHDKAGFALTRMHANAYYRGNTVLVGDAAHSINPLAGQGVNLGFKDVDCLITAIAKQQPLQTSQNMAWQTAFADYEKQRRGANLAMMSAMDVFYQTFSNRNVILSALRNIALLVADRSGPLKQRALKYAMGI